MNKIFIDGIAKREDVVVPTLFKPVQFSIIKKLSSGSRMTENEKRYLRGNMKKKFYVLQEIMEMDNVKDDFLTLLRLLGSCYITGLEALKHNGYGWYFEPKIIEVINTKIRGTVFIKNKTVKFVRVKSVKNSKIIFDPATGINYADNEQIMKDTLFTKNLIVKKIWLQMFNRYKKMFSQNIKMKIPKEEMIDYSKYGV